MPALSAPPYPSTCAHVKDDPDDWFCVSCDAEQCPVCEGWFPDYPALLDHTDAA